jgi:hypothetical protein
MYIFDQTHGKSNGDSQKNDISAGIHHLYLYVSKELSDMLSLDVAIDNSISASATPSLGSDITRATSGTIKTSVHRATLTALLPGQFELKTGVFNPMFSEEYSKETWWDEQYHGNSGLLYLEAWHDAGLELYKSFDFDNWSLPAYISLLNGNSVTYYGSSNYGEYTDNNDGKTVLLHLAPEFFNSQLRLLSSAGYGTWDTKDKYAAYYGALGAEAQYHALTVSGEYLYRKYENITLTGDTKADGERKGFYVKALYRFDDHWRAFAKFSRSDLYSAAAKGMLTDTYNVISFGGNYFITESSDIIAQISFCDAERSDGSKDLTYNRFTLGWRTTF